MKISALLALSLAFAAGGFLAGNVRGHRAGAAPATDKGRQILYYVDPMNPAHTSDRPGFAPCGMKMEPVYAEADAVPGGDSDSGAAIPGTVKISTERQQLAGVQVASVLKQSMPHTVRVSGRVVVDETRVYHINVGVNGRVGRAFPFSTGSLVKQDDVLAEIYSPEVLPAVQSLLFALSTREAPADGAEPGLISSNSLFEIDVTYQQSLEALRHLGMGQRQLDDLVKTRKLTRSIAVTSPADGILLARNASDDLHVEKGHELFRVADLTQVWVLADVSGWEADYLKPGSEVRLSIPRRSQTYKGIVSRALPLIDAESRTLKLRIETHNPEYALRPDMFVDVEFLLELPEMILVSTDAVLDTGRKQTVFADRGGGCFEPREVKTGRRLRDHVEIVSGLAPGERIVVSGNFLLDSESRMKLAAVALSSREVKDPVCGMTVDEQEVKAAGCFSEYMGHTYYFCNQTCKRSFVADPIRFLKPSTPGTTQTAHRDASNGERLAHHPVLDQPERQSPK